MAKGLKDALKRNANAVRELDRALRDCLCAPRVGADDVVKRRIGAVAIAQNTTKTGGPR
ncbi:MAG: hypothetical protein ACC646_12050 [Paracoccaceae bacterium]